MALLGMADTINEKAIRDAFRNAKADILTNTQHLEDMQRQIIALQNQVYSLQEKLGQAMQAPASGQLPPSSSDLKAMLRDILKDMDVQSASRKITPSLDLNKKSAVKDKILDALQQSSLALPRLKDRIVDEFGYCSKASFYRYMDELRQEGKILIDETLHGAIVKPNKIQIIE